MEVILYILIEDQNPSYTYIVWIVYIRLATLIVVLLICIDSDKAARQ